MDRVIQGKNEPLRDFVRRFIRMRNSIPSVSNEAMIKAFKFGVRDQRLTEDLEITARLNVNKLFRMAERYADADDAIRWKHDYDQGKLGLNSGEAGPSNAKSSDPSPTAKKQKRDRKNGGGRPRVVVTANGQREVMEVQEPVQEEPRPQ